MSENIIKHWGAIVNYMDDEKRETVHAEFSPCSESKFLLEYIKLDADFADLLQNEFGIDAESVTV